jgi:hypothetical protein
VARDFSTPDLWAFWILLRIRGNMFDIRSRIVASGSLGNCHRTNKFLLHSPFKIYIFVVVG